MNEFSRQKILLNNGMNLFFIEKEVYDLVIVGAIPIKQTEVPLGLPHLCEHLNFYKSKENIYNRFILAGSKVDAVTNFQGTVYYAHTRRANFEKVIGLFIRLLTERADFTSSQYQNEMKIVNSEIQQFSEKPPCEVECNFYKKLMGTDKLAYPIVGTPEALSEITREDIDKLYEDQYRPQRMNLYIGGRLENKQEIIRLINGIIADNLRGEKKESCLQE